MIGKKIEIIHSQFVNIMNEFGCYKKFFIAKQLILLYNFPVCFAVTYCKL